LKIQRSAVMKAGKRQEQGNRGKEQGLPACLPKPLWGGGGGGGRRRKKTREKRHESRHNIQRKNGRNLAVTALLLQGRGKEQSQEETGCTYWENFGPKEKKEGASPLSETRVPYWLAEGKVKKKNQTERTKQPKHVCFHPKSEKRKKKRHYSPRRNQTEGN